MYNSPRRSPRGSGIFFYQATSVSGYNCPTRRSQGYLNKVVDEINLGHGTAGKFIKDPALYDNANQTLAKANQLMTDINSGKGTLGKLAKDEALAKKLDETVTRLNVILDRLEKGEGTAGKLMVDPSLYNNADATLASTHELIEAIKKDPKKYLTIHLKVF